MGRYTARLNKCNSGGRLRLSPRQMIAAAGVVYFGVHLTMRWVEYSKVSRRMAGYRLSSEDLWMRQGRIYDRVGGDSNRVNQTGSAVYVNTNTGHEIDVGEAASFDNVLTKRTGESTFKPKLNLTGRGARRRVRWRWNDQDPLSYRQLPLRNSSESEEAWNKSKALVYNRVVKCGSRTILQICRILAAANKFNVISSSVYFKKRISPAWQHYILRSLNRLQTPYLYDRHLYFVDFTSFGMRQPMYINVIRDPVSMFVSLYYFMRFGDGKTTKHYKGSDEELNRSVTDCIMESHEECSESASFNIIPYFCGQMMECGKPSQWALDIAKANVEKHFVVVGILEDLENTFRVFEKELPQYFNGAVSIFLNQDESIRKSTNLTTTTRKQKPSTESTAILKKTMHYEYEFYDFIRERLKRQMKHHGIDSRYRM